jgi:hypothetical protein
VHSWSAEAFSDDHYVGAMMSLPMMRFERDARMAGGRRAGDDSEKAR